MRGTATLLPAKSLLKQFRNPPDGSIRGYRMLATSTLKKQEGRETGEEKAGMTERADPIVAFSRPPPLPPVFGPLVALSLFEAWTSRENNDD